MNAHDRLIFAQTDGGARIGTARDHLAPLRSGRSTLLQWFKLQAAGRFFKFDARPLNQVRAEVNHGHWIVKCPVCPGAEEADPLEPVFYCLSCGNAENASRVMDVVFPDAHERAAIELVLLRRPVANRNWRPGERPADLLAENAAHGGMGA